ncbi:hypothetical protein AAG906_013127 [Vitis piasezkii]
MAVNRLLERCYIRILHEARKGNSATTNESLRMDDNFLMWKYQIENVVRVMVLKVSCLESKILVPNPKFRDYQRQDHLLISWLLSSIGSAFLPQLLDHILAIMQGLGDEYEFVIDVISSKNSNRGSSSSWNSNGYPSSGFHNRNQFGGNRGRGRGRAQGGIKPQCQLCNKFGHTVHRCFYRYDPNFHGNMPANGPTPGVLGSGARNGASGSISNQDYSEMEAMVATPEDLQNCCWFPDSGATNHVTHDLGNLNSGAEYNASIPSSSNLYALPGTIPLSTNSDEPNESINTRPVTLPQQPHHMVTRSKNGIFKPKVYLVDLNVEEPNTFQKQSLIPNGKKQWMKNLEL